MAAVGLIVIAVAHDMPRPATKSNWPQAKNTILESSSHSQT
jgi:hypothetical protein